MANLKTVMIVDDNHIDQELYKMIVEKSGLCSEVFQFYMAEDALNYLTASGKPMPDLILLDVHMPRMNGFQFLEQYEAQLGPAACPVVVMLTTSLNPGDVNKAKEFSSVKKYINKPLTSRLFDEIVTEFGNGKDGDR